MKKLNWEGVTAEAVTRIILLVLSLINMCLQMFGYSALPINNTDISNVISIIFVIITAAWNVWKNFNVTTASQKAQQITDMIKNGELLVDQIDYIIDQFKSDPSPKIKES